MIKLFAEAQGEHMRKYGSKREHYDAICYKNHRHSVHTPMAVSQKEFPMKMIADAKPLFGPITKVQGTVSSLFSFFFLFSFLGL